MENYNTGKPIKLNDTDVSNYEQMAEDFSEGNPLLKECLLQMWQKGIETISCCNGHDDDTESYPFVFFKIDDKDFNFVGQLVGLLTNRKIDDFNLRFSNFKDDNLVCSIEMESLETRDEILSCMCSAMLNMQQLHGQETNIIDDAYCLNQIAIKRNIDFYFIWSLSKMFLEFTKKGYITDIQDEPADLRIFNFFRETRGDDIPLHAPFKCEIDSLEEFIDFFKVERKNNNSVKK